MVLLYIFQIEVRPELFETVFLSSSLKIRKGEKNRTRVDYDIALLRLDYPVADPGTGMTVLEGAKFNKETIMPICLPTSTMFKDTGKTAIAVGLGLNSEQ